MSPTLTSAIFHPISSTDQNTVNTLRLATAGMKGSLNGPAARPAFAAIMAHTPTAGGIRYEADTVGGVPGYWVRPTENTSPASAVLFLHGGAFVMGSATTHRALASQLAARTKIDFFVPDYPLAPEYPFPAAGNAAWAVYQGLTALGKQHLALAGDSAGGNLALAVAARAAHEAITESTILMPQATLVFSPWTDLALTSGSMQNQAAADPIFTQEALASFAQHYLQGHDARDMQASPVYGILLNLPPLQIQVGSAEVLLDDSFRYAEKARAAGLIADLHVWEGLPHGFAANVTGLQAAGQALDLGAAFLTLHLA